MKKQLIKGNDAIAMAAIEAGCRYYFGYPITPQNEIPEYLSREFPKIGGTFIQAESEIASINMMLGASATGRRTMTSSSGPGLSLMQEGISYMAGSEIPAFIVNISRSGPGLGGIAPSQADYFQATRGGGHGDYRVIVVVPASVQEMYDLTMLAFDLADKYRNPAMLLADAMLGQMKEPIQVKPYKPMKLPEKTWAVTGAKGRKQNILKSLYLGERELDAHIWRLDAKYEEMKRTETRWEEYKMTDATFAIAAFGSTARISKTAVLMAREGGMKVGLLRPIIAYPFPSEAYRKASEQVKKFLVVELNTGQMIEDVKLSLCGEKTEVHFYGRPAGAGALPTPEEILAEIKKYY